MKAITTQYIDGAFVESHGREVMDSINPNNGKVIARVTLGDDEDARRAISAAKRAFASFAHTTKQERSDVLLAGRVAINGMLDDPQAPWGGFKHSGVGREFGTFGIEAFLEPRAILE